MGDIDHLDWTSAMGKVCSEELGGQSAAQELVDSDLRPDHGQAVCYEESACDSCADQCDLSELKADNKSADHVQQLGMSRSVNIDHLDWTSAMGKVCSEELVRVSTPGLGDLSRLQLSNDSVDEVGVSQMYSWEAGEEGAVWRREY